MQTSQRGDPPVTSGNSDSIALQKKPLSSSDERFLDLAGGLPYPFMKIWFPLWAVRTAGSLHISSSSLLGKSGKQCSAGVVRVLSCQPPKEGTWGLSSEIETLDSGVLTCGLLLDLPLPQLSVEDVSCLQFCCTVWQKGLWDFCASDLVAHWHSCSIQAPLEKISSVLSGCKWHPHNNLGHSILEWRGPWIPRDNSSVKGCLYTPGTTFFLL